MEMGQIKKHGIFGKTSLILGIITIILMVLTIIFPFLLADFSGSMTIILILGLFCIILPIIATILGAISYFGKEKDVFGLAGFIMGIVLIIVSLFVITIAMAATTYIYISGIGGGLSSTPMIGLSAEPGTDFCTITLGSPTANDIEWSDISCYLSDLDDPTTIDSGITLPYYDSTYLKAGQSIIVTGLTDGNQYRLTLTYDLTGGQIGTCSWTQ